MLDMWLARVLAQGVVCVLGYCLAVYVGHYVVLAVLRRLRVWARGGVPGAGALIGALERAMTITFVLLGQYTALGLILTAKSITRFEKLKDRRFAEYYLVGTLASMLWAILVGLATRWACYEGVSLLPWFQ
ncbi:MAG: hypothetical protein ONB17_04525 [candidate division KSB1 bacterium]|nr:hypothetical protein [candidate division KSB1 bacterium]MDZ7379298.1 hypothetical protein [candidate division KSB1 bacterium]MDZ7385845.1 hypothetical protein [candidate division KSB1 bacterium]MDZ7413474.1 hypothetical protein [candidate division KSB1 bacterium]